jgi:hypothetical protein
MTGEVWAPPLGSLKLGRHGSPRAGSESGRHFDLGQELCVCPAFSPCFLFAICDGELFGRHCHCSIPVPSGHADPVLSFRAGVELQCSDAVIVRWVYARGEVTLVNMRRLHLRSAPAGGMGDVGQ